MKKLARRAALLFVLGMVGCSGIQLTKPRSTDDPAELPKELQDKFVVTEVTSTPVPAPTPSPASPVEKKKKKKLEKPQPAPSPVAAFPYPNRRPEKDPIWVGEKISLDVTFFGLVAGTCTLEALPYKYVGGRKVYHVKGSFKSAKFFNVIYRLDDYVESFIDFEGLFSHRLHLVLDESKQTRDSLELYDSEKKQMFFWNRQHFADKEPTERKEYFPMEPFALDSLASVYYLRTLKLTEGETYKFPMISEGKNWQAEVLVHGRETLRGTPLGDVKTIRLKPQTRYEGKLQQQGDWFLWVTDDDRRLLVRIEANVKVGKVSAVLSGVEWGTRP